MNPQPAPSGILIVLYSSPRCAVEYNWLHDSVLAIYTRSRVVGWSPFLLDTLVPFTVQFSYTPFLRVLRSLLSGVHTRKARCHVYVLRSTDEQIRETVSKYKVSPCIHIRIYCTLSTPLTVSCTLPPANWSMAVLTNEPQDFCFTFRLHHIYINEDLIGFQIEAHYILKYCTSYLVFQSS